MKSVPLWHPQYSKILSLVCMSTTCHVLSMCTCEHVSRVPWYYPVDPKVPNKLPDRVPGSLSFLGFSVLSSLH